MKQRDLCVPAESIPTISFGYRDIFRLPDCPASVCKTIKMSQSSHRRYRQRSEFNFYFRQPVSEILFIIKCIFLPEPFVSHAFHLTSFFSCLSFFLDMP